MSWSNPSPDEATDAYYSARNRYYNAANQKSASERQEQGYISERNSARNQISSINTQRINFEKRLEGIEKIIKMLEGNGGWFTTNVPNTITQANKTLKSADESYRSSIRVTGGAPAASLETTFNVKTVEGDTNSASALDKFKSEKARLEAEIAELKRRLASLNDLVNTLNGKINNCNAIQDSLRRTMNSSIYDMNHYRQYMN